MTLAELEGRIAERRAQLAGLRAQVDAAAVYDEILQWIRDVHLPDEAPVSLVRAAIATGYSADHLGRLVRDGQLKNHGRHGRPLVRLSECPRRTVGSSAQPARGIIRTR